MTSSKSRTPLSLTFPACKNGPYTLICFACPSAREMAQHPLLRNHRAPDRVRRHATRPRSSTLVASQRNALTPSQRTNSFFPSRSLRPSETPCGSPPVDSLNPCAPQQSARFARSLFLTWFSCVSPDEPLDYSPLSQPLSHLHRLTWPVSSA